MSVRYVMNSDGSYSECIDNREALLMVAERGVESLVVTCPKHGVQMITRMYSTSGSCPKCNGKDVRHHG